MDANNSTNSIVKVETDDIEMFIKTEPELEIYEQTQSPEEYPAKISIKELKPREAKSVNAKCNVCGFIFRANASLVSHFKKKHPESELKPEYKCSDCEEFFPSTKQAKHHYKRVHQTEAEENETWRRNGSNLVVKCMACEIFGSRINITKHFQKFHPGLPLNIKFKCAECDELFNNPTEARMHLSVVHLGVKPKLTKKMAVNTLEEKVAIKKEPDFESETFHCEECNLNFRAKYNFLKHMSLSIHEPKVKCEICHRIFILYKDLFKHKFVKHLQKLTCSLCAVTFITADTLHEHLLVHDEFEDCDSGDIQCRICEKKLSGKFALERHTALVHKMKCGECHQICPSKTVLVEHILENHVPEESPHTSFFKAVRKRKHISVNATCNVCGKMFPRNQPLKRHFDTMHPGNELKVEYKCTECEDVFQTSSDYLKHKHSQHDEGSKKELVCKVCQRRFRKKQFLNQHYKTHTRPNEDKFFECYVCAKKFQGTKFRIQHFETEHPGYSTRVESKFYDCDPISDDESGSDNEEDNGTEMSSFDGQGSCTEQVQVKMEPNEIEGEENTENSIFEVQSEVMSEIQIKVESEDS